MKRHTLRFAITGVVLALVCQSFFSGPAFNGETATGAPGDGVVTCVTCHGGGDFGPIDIDFSLRASNGNPVDSFKAGQNYRARVTVNQAQGIPQGFGMQMVVLQDSDEENAGDLRITGNQLRTLSLDGRKYAEHRARSDSNVFQLTWRAPIDPGAGSVTFYIGAIAADGDNGATADNAALISFRLPEKVDPVPMHASFKPEAMKNGVYPNPVKDRLYSHGLLREPIAIYNSSGRMVQACVFEEEGVDVKALQPGVYFLHTKSGTHRIIKE